MSTKSPTWMLKVGTGTLDCPLPSDDVNPAEKMVSGILLFVENTKTVGEDGFRVHSMSSVIVAITAPLQGDAARGQIVASIESERLPSTMAHGDDGRLGMYVIGRAILGRRESTARRISLEKDVVT